LIVRNSSDAHNYGNKLSAEIEKLRPKLAQRTSASSDLDEQYYQLSILAIIRLIVLEGGKSER
jgi:hypothetical protein